MAPGLTRILSDLHFGERSSRVVRLPQLRPLLDGVSHLVLNGDTLDTRIGPDPAHTAACRAAVADFFPRAVPATTFVTGNHDADISPHHWLDLAGGGVFAIHGDIFFDNIVPWSADVPLIERLMAAEFDRIPVGDRDVLEHRLAVYRRVALAIPQRHQSEKRRLIHTVRLLADTAWPPTRLLRILRAWRDMPRNAAALTQRYRPRARFVVSGHTHLPGIWRMPAGITVINTGSHCRPLGGTAVDLTETTLAVRNLESRHGEFRLGGTIAEFPLAGSACLAKNSA